MDNLIRFSMNRALMVRVLIVVSLLLLLAGAVTPLLTTERFYFFSNTFTLASGLRQLVVNDQFLIAALVALFSIVFPVVKAIVLWLAASPGAARGSMLALANRFGKWSMLEVFIAALLIIALKLGPVVDATLHYGAYLLAGSVLVSGLASLFVAPEAAGQPIFSSPATLTAGAVLGAAAASLLIALLNPELLNLELLVGTPEKRCVQRTLRLDQLYAETSETEADYLGSIRTIDAGACPELFRDALDDYIDAWEALSAYDAAPEPERGWLDRTGEWLGLIATRDERLENVDEAWSRLADVALEHGVAAPAK